MLFLYGLLIGIAMILPGASGCLIAVILGVYEKALNKFNNLFKDFKNNFIYLFKLAVGIIIGCIFFGKIILFLYTKYNNLVRFLFVSIMIIGIKQMTKTKDIQINYIQIILSIIISFFLYILINNINYQNNTNSILNMFLSGFIYSSGKVLPGLSGSFILIVFGIYEYLLNIISNPFNITIYDMKIILPFIIGLIIGVIIFTKIVLKFMEKNNTLFNNIILGFIISSIIFLIPKVKSFWELLFGIVIFLISYIISNIFLKLA